MRHHVRNGTMCNSLIWDTLWNSLKGDTMCHMAYLMWDSRDTITEHVLLARYENRTCSNMACLKWDTMSHMAYLIWDLRDTITEHVLLARHDNRTCSNMVILLIFEYETRETRCYNRTRSRTCLARHDLERVLLTLLRTCSVVVDMPCEPWLDTYMYIHIHIYV